MPYIHRGCDGEIAFWRRKCKKCGYTWPISVLFAGAPPPDMFFWIKPIERGQTSYAKWGDKIPAAGALASRLPNWPRWVRISVAVVSILGIVYLVLKITGRI